MALSISINICHMKVLYAGYYSTLVTQNDRYLYGCFIDLII